MTSWDTALIQVFFQSDYGWLGNLLPLAFTLGMAWALSRKNVDFLFAWFPLVVCAKIIFPFFHISFVFIAFALFIANIAGSKSDALADLKSIPEKTKDYVFKERERPNPRAIKSRFTEGKDKVKRGLEKVTGFNFRF